MYFFLDRTNNDTLAKPHTLKNTAYEHSLFT